MLKFGLTERSARGRGSAEAGDAIVQSITDFRPLVCDDAEINSVADKTVVQDHVLAQGAFFGGAEFQDRGAGTAVARVAFQLDAGPTQRLEGVADEQKFA